MSQELKYRYISSPVRRIGRAKERLSDAKHKLACATERITGESVRRELAEVLLIIHDAEEMLTPALEEEIVQ